MHVLFPLPAEIAEHRSSFCPFPAAPRHQPMSGIRREDHVGVRHHRARWNEGIVSWTVMGSSGAMNDRERALRTLYEEQAGSLYTYTLRLLGGDHYRAEDLVQEALLRCWRTQDLTSGQPLGPWLFRWLATWSWTTTGCARPALRRSTAAPGWRAG
ncbi:sigma factor [Streptomyces sp. GESEQ-35]|uniref:sigma factor n=1 Tax=Streptomyces sp. GESEQ-35 TaxID=2812657 RepID=UPI0027E2D8B5|nr:sigma factor [Streptomyces sp. GESEQ-35]